MTSVQFHTVALQIYQNYWRIKAANALYRSTPVVAELRLDYTNVPSLGHAKIPVATESVSDALSALNHTITNRFSRNFLFALIAEFECRLCTRLASIGANSDGTLGKLQIEVQNRVVIPLALRQDLDEIRERRNAMIHHGDLARQRYVSTSTAVQPRAYPYVAIAALNDNIAPDEMYLTYATDVLIRYSNALG